MTFLILFQNCTTTSLGINIIKKIFLFSAYFLQTRCWTGLEQKLGETKVEDAVEGRTGIAIGYTHEFNENHSNSVG